MSTEETVLTQQEVEDKKQLKTFKVTYPMVNFGLGVSMAYFSVYAVYFYTNVYMMSAAVAGALTMVQTLFAWMGTPVMGIIVDKFSFKNGKFYPWIRIGTILTNCSYILIFALPALGVKTPLVAFFVACVISLSSPIYSTPTSASYVLLSSNQSDRRYFAIGQKTGRDGAKMIFGYIFPALLIAFTASMGEKNAYAICGVITGVIALAGYLTYSFSLKGSYVERNAAAMSTTGDKKKSIPISVMLKTVCTNRPLLAMFLMVTIHLSYYFIYTSCTTYMFKYVWNDFGKMAIFMLIFNLTAIVGALSGPIWRKIFKETKRCFVANIIVHVAFLFVLAIFFKPLGLVGFTVIFAISSFFMGMYENYFLPMFAAAADYSAWKTGSRIDGLTMSIYQLSTKLANFINAIIRTWFLVAAGLDAVVKTKVVTAHFISMMTTLYTWVPAALGVLTLLTIVFIFNLNDDKIAKISEDLKNGKTKATSDLNI